MEGARLDVRAACFAGGKGRLELLAGVLGELALLGLFRSSSILSVLRRIGKQEKNGSTHSELRLLEVDPVGLPVDPVDDSNLALDILTAPDHHNPVSRCDVPEGNAVLDLDEGRVWPEVSRNGGATELATAVGRRVEVRYGALEGAGEIAGRHRRREEMERAKEEERKCGKSCGRVAGC